jgi:hypothetical protein
LLDPVVEAGMTFKVASTDVAWWHRIGESGKPTRSWAACFSDPAKQTNLWDMAMALANELANFNIVVEKWGVISKHIDIHRPIAAILPAARQGRPGIFRIIFSRQPPDAPLN